MRANGLYHRDNCTWSDRFSSNIRCWLNRTMLLQRKRGNHINTENSLTLFGP